MHHPQVPWLVHNELDRLARVHCWPCSKPGPAEEEERASSKRLRAYLCLLLGCLCIAIFPCAWAAALDECLDQTIWGRGGEVNGERGTAHRAGRLRAQRLREAGFAKCVPAMRGYGAMQQSKAYRAFQFGIHRIHAEAKSGSRPCHVLATNAPASFTAFLGLASMQRSFSGMGWVTIY